MSGGIQCPRAVGRSCRAAARQRGAATVEYVLVALLVVLMLVAGPDVIAQLSAALRAVYSAMVYALSASWL